MERLMLEASRYLLTAGDLAVLAPQGAGEQAPAGAQVHELASNPTWRMLLGTAWRGRQISRAFMPDLVLASSGLMAPAAYIAARQRKLPYAIFVHGLDIVYPHPVYQRLFLPAIRRANQVIANSSYTAELARAKGISGDRLQILHPGVQTRLDAASAEEIEQFRRKNDLDGTLLLSVGRLTPRKGLAEFVDRSLPGILEAVPDALLVIVGEDATQALGQGVARDAIIAAARRRGVSDHIRFLGKLPEASLQLAWQASQLHVFPIRAIPGDVEGFGMVAMEAAARGLWTIAFSVGGVVDAVSPGQSGVLVAQNDYEGFSRAVVEALSGENVKHPEQARQYAQGFDWSRYGERLLEICRGLSAAG
ncbi:glycosyltransferase family 4 protein [Thiolapillus brandeum]|nr:glycosyltransferase family 4 protein [Thiolapillus brandeum]